MLNEPASTHSQQSPVDFSLFKDEVIEQDASAENIELQEIVAAVMSIDTIRFYESGESMFDNDIFMPDRETTLLATFEGRLLFGSEKAYDELDTLLLPANQMPIFREEIRTINGVARPLHIIHILSNRIKATPRPWWPNLVMFILTFMSVLLTGAGYSDQVTSIDALINNPLLLRHGLPYALAIMAILGTHEFGHYFAARRHNLAVTLPYFIPLPPPFGILGTLGAFIQLREPMRNRKTLLEVGAAGPLAGLVLAIPILIIGLLMSDVGPVNTNDFTVTEGNSIIYALSKLVIFGRFLPSGGEDVQISQLAFAGWVGLLVTGINLLPIGQLDGGHILYALVGDRAKKLYLPLLGTLFLLALLVTPIWFFMVALLFLFGQGHAIPLDAITRLDPRRRMISIVSLALFVLIFVPIPLTFNNPPENGEPRRRDGNTIENTQLVLNPIDAGIDTLTMAE